MLDIIEAKIKQSVSKKIKPLESKITDIENVIESTIVDAIKNIKLKEPKNGVDGKDGKDGRDGKSIKGEKGEQGIAGISIKGDKGNDGIGFEDASVNEGGDLIISRTDGKIINAGNVKGEKGETLIQYVQGGGGGSDRPYIDQKIAAVRSFKTISVSGQSDVVADSATDTLTLIAGSNVTLTTNATNDSITIASSGGGGGSSAFNDITSGTNTTAVMAVGTGGSLAATGSGTIVATSCTGNAATVTTNANLTGDVTSVGNATTLTNAPVIAKVLTGFTAGAGTVAATDSILQAIQKLDGNDSANYLTSIAAQSTGLKTGGVLSVGTGGAGVATTFTIASGVGQIVDNTVVPATLTPVTWSAKTDVSVTNIGTQPLTFIAIDSGGNVIQQATDFTDAQHRQYIVIGIAVHTNLTTVTAVNQIQHLAISPQSQLNDLMQAISGFNYSGNLFSANGANLNINKSAGILFKQGSNYATSANSPNSITTGALTAASFRYNNQTGAASASVTAIDPDNYDNAGSTTAVPVNKFTTQRIFLFPSNLVAIQRGQAVYNSLAEAKAAIQTETFVVNSSISPNGVLRAFLVVQQGTTALNSATNAFFLEAPKFGGTAGVGGLSVSTLQNAYDNSSSPEILTDSTRGAVSIKRGSAADTDTALEVLNNAGSTTFSVTGNGVITGVGTSLTGTAASLTAGAATILATTRAIYGNNFNGSAALTQIIASTYGGTGNGFTKFSGAASTEKTYTLPNASDTIACLGQQQLYTKQQNFSQATLTSTAASIAWDVSTGQTATHTLTENTTLANQTNAVAGATYQLTVIQHASAAKTLAFGTNYIFNGNSTISTTVSSVAIFTFTSDGTKMRGVLTQFAS